MTFNGGRKLFPIVMTGLAVAAVFLLAVLTVNSAQSQSASAPPRGPFMMAAGDKYVVWRIDQSSGRVSFCTTNTQSTDEKFLATRAPFCSAWSNN